MNEGFHVGWCPYCNQGWIDIVKDSLNNNLLLLCNECDTTWNDPADIELDKPNTYKFLGIAAQPVLNEIIEKGWEGLF